MTAVTTAPSPTQVQAPPTGWLHTGITILLVLAGAAEAGVAAFTNAVAGGAPRSTAIAAGVLVALGAFVTWANGHIKVVAQELAVYRTWLSSHGPDFAAALQALDELKALIPANADIRLTHAEQIAQDALHAANAASTAAAKVVAAPTVTVSPTPAPAPQPAPAPAPEAPPAAPAV